ncbi:hypothetical protein MOQ72_27110 [Saccharopolyspora sp. K220]|uniref:hypothetical protein n=1 Tax=Saccharopolyspora soli TaxID=2926618 RepID=UPI001F57CEBC|nr:hypothetical protein [Saccharopolyspora soli]MCI2421118.1 hypothetical protein [Saccharopolyspora soli]
MSDAPDITGCREYTPEEVEAVFAAPMEDVRAWVERTASARRPAVDHAIARLTGADDTATDG